MRLHVLSAACLSNVTCSCVRHGACVSDSTVVHAVANANGETYDQNGSWGNTHGSHGNKTEFGIVFIFSTTSTTVFCVDRITGDKVEKLWNEKCRISIHQL